MIAGASIRRALRAAGDRPLVYSDGGIMTATEVDAATDDLATMIRDQAGPGATVGLWYWNSPYALVAHLAVERAGATRAPVDPSAPPAEARAIFHSANVDLVLTDMAHGGLGLTETIVYDNGHTAAGAGPLELVEVDDDATALLFPRTVSAAAGLLAIPISFGNWESTMSFNARLFREGFYGPPVGEADVFLTSQQMMHGTGLVGTFPFLHLGLPQVILERFDASAVAEACLRFAVTTAFMVPGMVTRVAAEMARGQQTLPLTRLIYGGAPITSDELHTSLDRLGPILVQIYGRLEGGWPLTVLDQSDHARIRAGERDLEVSCGRALPGIDVEIRRLDSTTGATGELRVRSSMVSPAFRDPDGWCSLGDLASCDRDGYFRLWGRLDGMINTGSYHVYPAEVEEAIRALLPVAEVRVRGEPDPKWGEAVTAFVSWPPGVDQPTDDEFRHALAGRLARYKIPTRIKQVSQNSTSGHS